jgi:hypothetical protein
MLTLIGPPCRYPSTASLRGGYHGTSTEEPPGNHVGTTGTKRLSKMIAGNGAEGEVDRRDRGAEAPWTERRGSPRFDAPSRAALRCSLAHGGT